jgi:ubiquinone/menaquinone biosynthesis C-methylase UbiE
MRVLNSDQALDRIQREKEFHDACFEEQTRQRADVERFYKSANSSKAFYKGYLSAHCPGKRVLEYGCGADGYSIFLARLGACVTAIDISDVAIQVSRQRAISEGQGAIDYRVMDAEKLEFEDNIFDVVCGTAILHHLDFPRALGQIARVLKPNGSAVFIECLGHNPLINLYRRLTPHLRSPDEHPLRMGDLRRAKQQFESVDLRFFHLLSIAAIPFYRFPGSRVRTWLLDSVDTALCRVFPPLRRFCWAVAIVLSGPKK